MSREKTRLSPDEQWTSTVRYATRIHVHDPAADWAGWQQIYLEWGSFPGGVPPPEAEQREQWQAVRRSRQIVQKRRGSPASIAVVTRAHRWLNLGDLLHLQSLNGMNERFAYTGVSSKGVRLLFCYLRLDHGTGQGVVENFAVPDSLIGLRWDDEAVSAFAHQCRQQVMNRCRR